jgi:Homeodomain-like domain
MSARSLWLERARGNAHKLRAEGLSLSQVAERLGVSRSAVAVWLRGVGEWYELRECRLCGERFIARSGTRRFCTTAHANKFRRDHGRVMLDPPDEQTFALACQLADQVAEELQGEGRDELAA